MAHNNGKEIYRKLGKKIDNLPTRTPWNEAFYEILKELYTPEEAEVLINMPYRLASFGQVARCTKMDQTQLHAILDSLCEKGLVLDLWVKDRYRYVPAPLVVGIFELTMMRTRGDLRSAEWARLFHEYMHGTPAQQRVIHPETTFERIILASLERGTLQNQLFANPQSITHQFLRGFVGGCLRLPPVKRALLSDQLRSRFLATLKSGVQKQGKAWLLET